ncbi:MAG: ATP-binding protein [Cyanobacteria bacterium]|nr:ATP-binding protein [Cyanobacteriota bacterium]MDW8201292.1 DICT sensory domain-containing protein [Cyanobacteriota bacterium SKYGB_h_bin112]
MTITTFVLDDLLSSHPHLRSQIYFKSSLTALSHAMEDQVLAGGDQPLVIASFQRERFYRQEASRYLRIAERTSQVYVLAAPETDFTSRSDQYETIAFDPTEPLSQEWNLVVVGCNYATCLVCREHKANDPQLRQSSLPLAELPTMDQARRFEGIWTFDRKVTQAAALLMLDRILTYRPELAEKVAQAKMLLQAEQSTSFHNVDPAPFADRLVTYLQAGQYKLLKAYRSIAIQERKERLVNSITDAIRRSLDSQEILQVAVTELGQALHVDRCLIYRCKATDVDALIQHEFLNQETALEATDSPALRSLAGQTWPLKDNPLFAEVVETRSYAYADQVATDPRLNVPLPRWQTALKEGRSDDNTQLSFLDLAERWQIRSWLMVPVLYQHRLLGIVELHHCRHTLHRWTEDELSLINAIATQVGVALIQAEAYANLDDLNQQLEALDRTRSNLVAITGHELRTPLSTIQVCLESLASEPDMPLDLRQVMITTAMADAERMRKLIQDFLTLSRLESGRVEWRLEPLPIRECVDLALSSLRTRNAKLQLPNITTHVPNELPLAHADGEWMVEVITKLLDNACKFTEPKGNITIEAKSNGNEMLEVTVADTGRGIEPDRLEVVFDRFYQEEGALRRSTGGTGLGLAICRQIVTGMGGQIWAESAGRDKGSKFHFTIPIFKDYT